MRLAVYRNGLLLQHTTFTATSVRIGRLASSDLVLEGDEVARFHAVIDRALDGGGFELTDLSAGATRLNGAPVSRARLHEGDEVKIGRYRIVLASAGSSAYDMVMVPAGESLVPGRVSGVLWPATAEEMASEPATGEIAVRGELAKLKAE